MRIGLHRRSETIAKRGKKNDCCDRARDRFANIQNGSREAPLKGEIKDAERYCKEYSGDIGREIEPSRPSPKIKQADPTNNKAVEVAKSGWHLVNSPDSRMKP